MSSSSSSATAMDDQKMNPPTIVTSLTVRNEPSSTHMQKQPPWHAPFSELLEILKIIDKSKPTPRIEDQWFCFQPSHDLSEISKVFISVSTPGLRYDVDIRAVRLVGPDVVPPAAIKLQEYANQVLQRIRQFRDCLLQDSYIVDGSCFLNIDLLTCPLCLNTLNSCFECDAKVACSNPSCDASEFDCEQCFEHDRMTCIACLKENDSVPPLIRCPQCQTWCCREDMDWCSGLITHPVLGSTELAEMSRECDWDNEAIVRSHPPKPSPCRLCTEWDFPPGWGTCRNSPNDMKPYRCPSQTPYMTATSLRAGYCPDCVGLSPGHRCACGYCWQCNTCFVLGNKHMDYPHTLTCPRCGISYCTRSEPPCGAAIDFCRGCRGVIPCNNCQEEERLPGSVQTTHPLPKEVVFAELCGFCETWCCRECCALARTARCFHCDQLYCGICLAECDVLRPCPFCGGPNCMDCRRSNQICAGAATLWPMLSQNLNPSETQVLMNMIQQLEHGGDVLTIPDVEAD